MHQCFFEYIRTKHKLALFHPPFVQAYATRRAALNLLSEVKKFINNVPHQRRQKRPRGSGAAVESEGFWCSGGKRGVQVQRWRTRGSGAAVESEGFRCSGGFPPWRLSSINIEATNINNRSLFFISDYKLLIIFMFIRVSYGDLLIF